MSFNKHFFEQFKDEADKEHKGFKTHTETKELEDSKCDHKGKVKAIPGGLRCQCGAGWQGPQLNVLMDHFR